MDRKGIPPTTKYEIALKGVPEIGAVTIRWEHQDGRQTIQGKYNPLVVTHITRCSVSASGTIGESTLRCSIKDTYDRHKAKWGSLREAVKTTGWDSAKTKAFYDTLFDIMGTPKRRRK